MTDNGTPTPIAAIAYKKILKTSFGIADLDKADQAGATAEPICIETGLGEVRCLDGTLIRSDMLYETFWSAMARSWTTPLVATAALARGRAALKQRLGDLAEKANMSAQQ